MSNEVTKSELKEFAEEKERVKKYTNGDVTVFWRPDKCIHSANCILGSPRVFNAQKRPWITMEGADSDEVMRVVDTCPSRALLYMKNEGSPASDPERHAVSAGSSKVQILKDGPILISGDFVILDAQKRQIETETEVAAICRCGASKKKPFCDGNHTRIGFKD